MVYTDLTNKAMIVAERAHRGQKDKSGVPYIFHPIHLAEQMEDEISTCVALLHDVVEDTKITFEMLSAEGFGDEIIEPLRLLTHKREVPYFDYVRALAHNSVARRVKLADLRHNSDSARLPKPLNEYDIMRAEKYREATRILENIASSEADDT